MVYYGGHYGVFWMALWYFMEGIMVYYRRHYGILWRALLKYNVLFSIMKALFTRLFTALPDITATKRGIIRILQGQYTGLPVVCGSPLRDNIGRPWSNYGTLLGIVKAVWGQIMGKENIPFQTPRSCFSLFFNWLLFKIAERVS